MTAELLVAVQFTRDTRDTRDTRVRQRAVQFTRERQRAGAKSVKPANLAVSGLCSFLGVVSFTPTLKGQRLRSIVYTLSSLVDNELRSQSSDEVAAT